MKTEEFIARLIDSKAINGEEAICLLQSTKHMEEVFVPFTQVKEFGTHGNPYSPIYPCPEVGKVITTANGTFNTTASSITLEEKEITIDGWVARDKNNVLCLFNDKPFKRDVEWDCVSSVEPMLIESKFFPEVKWEDKKPTKVKIIIEKV